MQGAGIVGKQRSQLLDKDVSEISRTRQCELLGVPRSSSYYKPQKKDEDGENKAKEMIKTAYQVDPCLGRRRLPMLLRKKYGLNIGPKKLMRLKREMQLRTIYNRSQKTLYGAHPEDVKYPYIVRDMGYLHPNDVWSSDITVVKIKNKHYYICAVLDWASRKILGWRIGPNMTTDLCLETLDKALESGLLPRVFNTDQGSQYTSREWQSRITGLGVQISLDGRGRWQDNSRMERFWRSLKHECFLLHDFESMEEAAGVCGKWIKYYNEERPHQELGNLSPDEWLAEQLKSTSGGAGSEGEERAEAHPSPRAPSLRSEPLGVGDRKKGLTQTIENATIPSAPLV